MDDKQNITLKIDVHTIPLQINKEDEEDYRKAAFFLNERIRIIKNKNKNANISSERMWVYLALECCTNLMSDKRDKAISPINKAIDNINNQIEKVLNSFEQPN